MITHEGERFDPDTNTWVPIVTKPAPAISLTMYRSLKRGEPLMAGDVYDNDTGNGPELFTVDAAEVLQWGGVVPLALIGFDIRRPVTIQPRRTVSLANPKPGSFSDEYYYLCVGDIFKNGDMYGTPSFPFVIGSVDTNYKAGMKCPVQLMCYAPRRRINAVISAHHQPYIPPMLPAVIPAAPLRAAKEPTPAALVILPRAARRAAAPRLVA